MRSRLGESVAEKGISRGQEPSCIEFEAERSDCRHLACPVEVGAVQREKQALQLSSGTGCGKRGKSSETMLHSRFGTSPLLTQALSEDGATLSGGDGPRAAIVGARRPVLRALIFRACLGGFPCCAEDGGAVVGYHSSHWLKR